MYDIYIYIYIYYISYLAIYVIYYIYISDRLGHRQEPYDILYTLGLKK